MALGFEVFADFKNRDSQVNKSFKKMARGAVNFGEKTDKAFRKASKSASMFKSVTGGILAAGALSRGLGLVARGATAVASGFLDFDQAITSASAKFKGLDLSTAKGQETLEKLRMTARQTGRDTEFSADQAAAGLDFLALASFNAEQAMALLPGVTNLATATQIDLATATDIASDSLGAFGLMTSDTVQLTKNFTRVQDVMARTTTTSNTSLIDLFEAVRKGAPAFTAAGQSMESFNALAGVLANSAVKGSEAGTQLRNVMIRLAKPSKEAALVLKDLGVKTGDAEGNFRDVIDILADLEKGLKGAGTKTRSAAIATIFQARSMTGINILLKAGTENLRSYRQMLIDSGGASKKMAEIMRSSLINRLKSLGSAALEVGFQIFDAFDEKGAKAIDSFTRVLRGVNLKPILDDLVKMSEKFAEITSRTEAFQQLGKTFKAYKETFKAASAALKVFSDLLPDFGDKLKFIDLLLAPVTSKLKNMELAFKGIELSIKAISSFASRAAEIVRIGPVAARRGSLISRIEQESAIAGDSGVLSFEREGRREQPTRRENQQQNINFSGKLNIAGAPPGSTFEQEKGPPLIDVSFSAAPAGL